MKQLIKFAAILLCTVCLYSCTSGSQQIPLTEKALSETFISEEMSYNDTIYTVPTITEAKTTSHADNCSSAQMRYILNNSTKKFHYPDCSSVKQMADKNRKVVTLSREDVIAMGYIPCGRCHP